METKPQKQSLDPARDGERARPAELSRPPLASGHLFARNLQDEHSAYFPQNHAGFFFQWNELGRLHAQDLIDLAIDYRHPADNNESI